MIWSPGAKPGIRWPWDTQGPKVIPRDLLRGKVPLGVETFIHPFTPVVNSTPSGGPWRRVQRWVRSRYPVGPREGWHVSALAQASQQLLWGTNSWLELWPHSHVLHTPRPGRHPHFLLICLFPSASFPLLCPSVEASGELGRWVNSRTPHLPLSCPDLAWVTLEPRLMVRFAFQGTSTPGESPSCATGVPIQILRLRPWQMAMALRLAQG